jgi:hypothetical protein
MIALRRANARLIGGALLLSLLVALMVQAGTAFATPAHAHQHSAAGDATGTTGGWYDGKTVTFFYPKSFFCQEPPTTGADSQCELGAEAQVAPRAGVHIPVLYVMTPLGFRPDEATLQCPVVGQCINHPSTIDVSRVFGPGTENFALPAHSHIVDVAKGGWWEIEVIGVTDPAVWAQVVAGKDLATVRTLQAAGVGITGDIPTNLFLFFNVQQ